MTSKSATDGMTEVEITAPGNLQRGAAQRASSLNEVEESVKVDGNITKDRTASAERHFRCKDHEKVNIGSAGGRLEIDRATYGGRNPNRDYTAKVRSLVNNGKISVIGGIHTRLGDPEPGVPKTFNCWYRIPVDCQWGQWGSWAAETCSKACGGGTQKRTRKVAKNAVEGGSGCSGPFESSETCNTHACPITCQWGSWAEWEECSVTCGGGTHNRTRLVATKAAHGGSGCSGDSESSQACNTEACPTTTTTTMIALKAKAEAYGSLSVGVMIIMFTGALAF